MPPDDKIRHVSEAIMAALEDRQGLKVHRYPNGNLDIRLRQDRYRAFVLVSFHRDHTFDVVLGWPGTSGTLEKAVVIRKFHGEAVEAATTARRIALDNGLKERKSSGPPRRAA